MRRGRRHAATPADLRAHGTSTATGRGDRLWRGCLVVTTWVGLGCALLLWGLVPTVGVVVTVALLSGLLVFCAAADLSGLTVRSLVRTGLLCGATLTAAAALVATFDVSGLLLVLAALATSPPVRSRLGRTPDRPGRAAPDGAAGPPDIEPSIPEVEPSELDDVALCRAWRHSFLLLQGTSRVDGLVAVTALRQRYLDELVRRHPAEIARWLASRPRAAGNPLPFLRDRGGDD